MDDIYIYNPTQKKVSARAFGSWFTFDVGQMKRMRPDIGDFLAKEKGYLGLVEVESRLYDDKEFLASEEGQQLLAKYKAEGVEKRIRHLKGVVHNETVSLRKDLETANIKADPKVYMSDGGVEAMQELVGYQQASQDEEKSRVKKIRDLENALHRSANAPAAYQKKDS